MKKKTGRPSKYETINQEQLKKIVLKGFTDEEIADFFNITVQTLNNYKREYPEFFSSLKDWKIEADLKVEKALYKRALGYKYDEITYEKSKTGGLGIGITDGEVTDIKNVDTYKTKIITKEVPSDVTACIFWLKNRQPDQWREKVAPEEDETLKNQELEFSSLPENGKIPQHLQRFLN